MKFSRTELVAGGELLLYAGRAGRHFGREPLHSSETSSMSFLEYS